MKKLILLFISFFCVHFHAASAESIVTCNSETKVKGLRKGLTEADKNYNDPLVKAACEKNLGWSCSPSFESKKHCETDADAGIGNCGSTEVKVSLSSMPDDLVQAAKELKYANEQYIVFRDGLMKFNSPGDDVIHFENFSANQKHSFEKVQNELKQKEKNYDPLAERYATSVCRVKDGRYCNKIGGQLGSQYNPEPCFFDFDFKSLPDSPIKSGTSAARKAKSD